MKRYRTSITKSRTLTVEESGGKFDNGVIRGYSLCTVGEALGHEQWCDSFFIQQVADQLKAAGQHGVKSRYTHGSMSADGIEDSLGRTTFTGSSELQCFGDLHFSEMANEEKRRQVLAGAKQTPEDFGASIVFELDTKAATEFALEHGAVVTDSGRVDWEEFKSPDPANINNYPHVRLKTLKRSDIVGDPAANPSGLFGEKDQLFTEAQAMVEYALGQGGAPELELLPFEAENAKAFVRRVLQQHRDAVLDLLGESAPERSGMSEFELERHRTMERLRELRNS